jgi:DNA helicase-2/ATP-dependent DNA helicase PcrA
MLDESGYMSHVLSLPGAIEKLAKLNGLVDAFKEAVAAHHAYTLADLVEYVSLLERHNVSVRKDTEVLSPERVRLMTAHRSKGLEFDYVYVTGLQDSHWRGQGGKTRFYLPIGRPDEEDEAVEAENDDRRLFYVSLTRARAEATLTYATSKDDGSPALPSQYLEEISPTLVAREDTSLFESSVSPAAFLSARYPAAHSVKDKLFLNELFLDQGLSVTALNNYLSCPWKYFYGNLLRVPKAPDKYALFGTAIHSALRQLYESIERGATLNREEFLERFQLAAQGQPFSTVDLADALKKGELALGAYYERYKESWGVPAQCEFSISTLYPVQLGEARAIPLRGVLDRVEAGKGSDVVVFDYKTGRPKSRNEIEGATRTSTGDYKRQLVFYKLLLSLHAKGGYASTRQERTMREGVIDFIEPDPKGRFHQERFYIEDEEVSELKSTIERVAQEIYNLDFWQKRCEDKACEFCRLRDFLPNKKAPSQKKELRSKAKK